MKRSARTFKWMAAMAALLIGPGIVMAGGDDPLMRHPDVFVIYDISGSMTNQAMINPPRDRLTASIEVLTGTGNFPLHSSGNCPPGQADDGIIDVYKNLIRFGVGAFDVEECDRDGTNVHSYGPDTGGHQGLGIRGRNSGMGKLVDVVDPDNPEDLAGHNEDVQNVICGLTTEGCTPLAASLYDARQYFLNYENELRDSNNNLYHDPMGRNGGQCRQQFVLLMTDGQEWPTCCACPAYPNGDFCDEGNGAPHGTGGCPSDRCSWYGNEAVQAEHLANDINVPVFVVAFGSMNANARMRMHRIARAGAGLPRALWTAPEDFTDSIPEAFFAANPAQLRIAFTIILDAILAGAASRTSSSTAPSSTAFESTYEYKATFELGLVGPTWKGFITRDKLEDTDDDGDLEQVERLWLGPPQLSVAQNGDLFRPLPAWNARRLLTIVKDPRSKEFIPSTINPNYRLPRYENAAVPEDGIWPFMTAFPDNGLMCLQDPEGMGSTLLEATIKQYTAGKPLIPSDISGLRFSLPQPWGPHLGDIFHSNPIVVTPPSALTPDFKYEEYFRANMDRHTMVYAGANDGFLHAFVGEDNRPNDGVDDTGKELWAFMPFNLLAKIEKIRWGAHQFFVDSPPVVRDVYFPNIPTPDPGNPGHCLKDASNACLMGAYRTVLMVGEREGGPAYFALDITDPENPGYLWEYRTTGLLPDYSPVQCQTSKLQTWAEPIVGEVWLRDASTTDPTYMTKSVAVIPGGYLPPISFATISSCVEILELMVGAGSVHILDMETGELLKRFNFGAGAGSQVDYEAMQQALDDFYAEVATGSTSNWNHWGQGQGFGTSDFSWNAGTASGWNCNEQRGNIQDAPMVPPELLDPQWCDIIENVGDIAYQRACCVSGVVNFTKCNNFPGTGGNLSPNACSYLFREYTDGRIESWLNTPNTCPNTWNFDAKNKFHLQIANASLAETMAATPAAYNPNLGEFITRVFGATNMGRIYRMSLANAQYDPAEPEGQKVQPYTNDATKDWKLEPDGPWYDPFETGEVLDGTARRPISVTPDLAVDYQRDLVLFFGTGEVDNLEFNPNLKDWFFAVKEIREDDTDGYYVPSNAKGKLLDDVHNTMDGFWETFAPAERLFGQPMVLFGRVYFSTFTPDNDECETGQSKFYSLDFDDFDNQPVIYQVPDKGAISKPAIRWTASGRPQVVVQLAEKVIEMPEIKIRPRTTVMSWGKVL